MASARFAWGIDIGNRALKAIRLSRGDAGLVIDDFEVIEHENVLSNTGDNRDSIIQSALANFVQRHAIKGGVVAISVSGVSSFARFIKLPPVEARKIPEIVRFEAIQQIPFPLDDVEWSYQLFQAPESPDVEVGIFAMRRELINSHIKHFTDVDLNVQYVQMNPLAVYNAMYYDGRLKGTTMIIDLGAENTDLIIADGETIWLRSIPIGGNNFTEVLVKSFKLPFAKAEELKRNAATSKYARQIFQAMRPVFADLVAEVQRSMGFYASVHRESRIKKIIALGGTFRLPGLQKYLQQNLQLDVDRMDRLAAGAPADGKLATTFNENLLSLVSAYGLAIQAMGEAKITSSLLPQHIRREKMWRDKTKWFGAAAALFVLGTSVAVGKYYWSDVEYRNGDTIKTRNIATLTSATALNSEWKTKVEGGGAIDRLRITNVRDLLKERNLWPNLTADLFAQLPPLPRGMVSGLPADIAAMKATPRGSRPILLIDKIESEYKDDLLKALASYPALVGTVAAPGAAPAAAVAAPSADMIPPGSRGFVLTISLTTPNQNAFRFVLNGYKQSLATNLSRDAINRFNAQFPQNRKDYYIAKVSDPINTVQLKDDPARVQALQQSFEASLEVAGKVKDASAGAMPGGGAVGPGPSGFPLGSAGFSPGGAQFDSRDARDRRQERGDFERNVPRAPMPNVPPPMAPPGPPSQAPVAAAPATPAINKAFYDRITDEDRLLDWEMKLQVVVVINAPAKAMP